MTASSVSLSRSVYLARCRSFFAPAPAVRVTLSGQASVKFRRRHASCPAKGGGERACLAEADGHADLRHRRGRLRQELLGAFDAARRVIAVRRHTQGPFERPAEVVRAQFRESSEGTKW